MDDNHRSTFTDVKFAIKDVLTLGRLTFASYFEKLILIAFIATGQIGAFFVKFANELALLC